MTTGLAPYSKQHSEARLRPPAEQDARLRIGVVAPVWVPIPPTAYGGVEWIVHSLVEGLTARGHHVTLVASADSTSRAACTVATYGEAPYKRLGETLPELIHGVQAFEAISDHDVIHDHTLAGPALAQMSKLEVLHTVHGPLEPELLSYYQHCPNVRLIAISEAQRNTAPELNWAGTVHNAIDVASFPFRAGHDGYLAFLARMHPNKGLPQAIELARSLGLPLRIAAKLNEPAEFNYYRRVIEPLLGPDATYIGELKTDEKREFLAGARALVFPIQWEEPFGLAMIEALACGTPVLALARGSVPEIVRHGQTGLVGADLSSLVDLARRNLDSLDPAACRRDAQIRFDVSRMLDNYETLYRLTAGERLALR